jgi:hypothetical protein
MPEPTEYDAELEEEPLPLWSPHMFTADDIGYKYLRRKGNIQNEIATVKAAAAEIVAALEAKEARLDRRYKDASEKLAFSLLPRKPDGELLEKTLKTLYGSMLFTHCEARTIVSDADAAADYAREKGFELFEFVEKFDGQGYVKLALMERVATGELLPGTEIVPERESLSIRFTKKKG